ncbi:MAG: lactate utilization protein C [bacterium]|nr:lactate utilization protein C [bacterium]
MESARRHDITAHIHAGMQSAAREMAAIVLEQEPEWGAEKSVVAWRHPLVEGLKLPEALAPHRVPVHFCDHDVSSPVEKQVFVTKAATACVGITSADFCLADSGTLVLKTRPGQALSVSIAPSVHMAVFAAEQIVADLKELYALLTCEPGHAAEGLTRSMTFVCGPSKTADIEATLIHGAHGPREVHIFIIRS